MAVQQRGCLLLGCVENWDRDVCEWPQPALSVHDSCRFLQLREFSDMRRGSQSCFAVIDRSLIALIRERLNRIEIYRLEVCPSASAPLLQTMCLLELPPVTSTTSVTCLLSFMEWVPTSRHYKWSRSSRGYHIPFYSSVVGTIALPLHYHMASGYSSHVQ